MMLYPAMKDLLAKVPSRYELVNVVACRARQISNEAEQAGEHLEDKPVTIAPARGGRRQAGGRGPSAVTAQQARGLCL